MGAGILPITIEPNKQEIMVILGRERYDKKWSDFGGKSKKNELDVKTALREGYEELNNGDFNFIFINKKELEDIVYRNSFIEYSNENGYKSYLFYIPYEFAKSMVDTFNFKEKNEDDLIKKSNYKIGLFEKDKIELFNCSDLVKMNDNIRIFYKNITTKIILNKKFLKILCLQSFKI